MIREKAKYLLTKLKEGTGSTTIFCSSYYDEETLKIIDIVTNECKSTVISSDGIKRRYESDIKIHNIKDLIKQLLTDKNTIKNSLVSELTTIAGLNIPGPMIEVRVNKKVNENGLPYIEVEKPLPDNLNKILTGDINREELLEEVIRPYVARICKYDPELSKRHRFSKLFSPLSFKEITDEELKERIQHYLTENTDLDARKTKSTTQFFLNILNNKNVINDLTSKEIDGKSILVVGEKKKNGYNGMIQNISNELIDFMNSIENPNESLKELEDIYANIVGQLEAMSIITERDSRLLEDQIKSINRYINRHRGEYYGENGYRTIDVGFKGQKAGLLKTEFVPQAMKLYSESLLKLLEQADQMDEKQYIKEVAKLHFRFIQIHPFPDGNGRTGRAISNMLLLEKNIPAIFSKLNKTDYIRQMNTVRLLIDREKYIEGLYTDQNLCDEIEEESVYRLEEFIGIKCLNKPESDYGDITEELPELAGLPNLEDGEESR